MDIEQFLKTNKKLPISLKAIINIMVLGGRLKREINEFLKAFGISEPQFNVLRILRGQNGQPANLKNVQERMVHKTSNTTRLVDKLIEKGFVERIIPEENRRKVEISITQKGLELLAEINPSFTKLENRLAENLNKAETAQLNGLLEKMGDWK